MLEYLHAPGDTAEVKRLKERGQKLAIIEGELKQEIGRMWDQYRDVQRAHAKIIQKIRDRTEASQLDRELDAIERRARK